MAESAATRLTELSGTRKGYQSLHDEDGGDDGDHLSRLDVPDSDHVPTNHLVC